MQNLLVGFYIAGLFSILFSLSYLVYIQENLKFAVILSILQLAFIVFVFWIVDYKELPELFRKTRLFSPQDLSLSGILKSFGALIILSVSFFSFSVSIRQNIKIGRPQRVVSGVLGLLFMIVYFEIFRLYVHLLGNSVITMELYKVHETNYYSWLSYICFILLFGGWYLLVNRLIIVFINQTSKRETIFTLIISLIITLIFYGLGNLIPLNFLITCLLLLILILFIEIRQKTFSLIFRVLFLVIIFVFQSVIVVWMQSKVERETSSKVYLVNLTVNNLNERDFDVEPFLMEVGNKMISDKILPKIVEVSVESPDNIESFLSRKFFGEILNRYEIQVVTCYPQSDLYVGEDEKTGCYNYFLSMLEKQGEQLQNSPFYYLNSRNGRFSYFAVLKFYANTENEISLFVEVESKIVPQGAGYQQLLEDNSKGTKLPSNYSYARYIDGNLITRSGDFSYSVNKDWIPEFSAEFSYIEKQGMEHWF